MSLRLIIVEGPDASGKTTLAQFIAQKTLMTYIHMSGEQKLHFSMPEYHEAILQSIEWNLNNTACPGFVLDRFWPSEQVYGREFRPSLVDRYDFKGVQDRLAKLGAKYVFCFDDYVEERHERMHVAKDHREYDRAEFHGVVQGYQALMSVMVARPDVILYNMQKQGAHLFTVVDRLLALEDDDSK